MATATRTVIGEVRVYHFGLRSHEWLYDRKDGRFVVGYYDPQYQWVTIETYESQDEAATRVHFLNGGAENRDAQPHQCARLSPVCQNCDDFRHHS